MQDVFLKRTREVIIRDFLYLLPFICVFLSCGVEQHTRVETRSIHWNRDCVEKMAKDPTKGSNPTYKMIISTALRYCLEPPVTVVNKPYLPEGCTKNDYVSLSTYAWPDSTKAGGMPYVLRDGYDNPEASQFNWPALLSLIDRMQILTLAWKLSGDTVYAEKALEQVRAWFINEDTRMAPNLKYAQIVPGVNNNEGNSYGVLDGYYFVKVLDPLLLLEDYTAFTKAERKAVKSWFTDFLTWITTSKLGIQESLSNNNHGTSYDCQVLAYCIYTGEHRQARRIIKEFPDKRINTQIEVDGTQPHELKRPRSFNYSVMNLDRMMDFLLMAKFYGHPVKEKKLNRYLKAWEFLVLYNAPQISDSKLNQKKYNFAV